MNHKEISDRTKSVLSAHGVTRHDIKKLDIEPLARGCSLVVTHDRRNTETSFGIYFNSKAEAEFAKDSLHSGTADVVPVREEPARGGNYKSFDPAFIASL